MKLPWIGISSSYTNLPRRRMEAFPKINYHILTKLQQQRLAQGFCVQPKCKRKLPEPLDVPSVEGNVFIQCTGCLHVYIVKERAE